MLFWLQWMSGARIEKDDHNMLQWMSGARIEKDDHNISVYPNIDTCQSNLGDLRDFLAWKSC